MVAIALLRSAGRRWLTLVAVMLLAFGCDYPFPADVPSDAAGPDASQAHELTSFAFPSADNAALSSDVSATINGTSISATVPFGTPTTALVATFSTTGTRVTVGAVAQTSDVTPNDFSSPVTYTVTAADGSTRDYVVTVTVAPSSAKDLTAFSFLSANNSVLTADVTATITGTSIAATVPFGTNVTALKATFSTTGASVTVNGVTQTSGVTANDFTSPVVYRVTAADSTTRDYTVTVTVAANPAKDITAYSFLTANNAGLSANVTATISGTSIAATVPFGTSVTALKATFSTTGTSVAVSGVVQTSGVTANNFTSPVVYRVTAADGSTKDYTITVTVAANSAKDLTAFSFLAANNPGLSADVLATISGTSITATVPSGTAVTALKASFTTTGASVTVNGVTQASGVTANNFTSPVVYRVTAADNSTKDYTVTVSVQSTENFAGKVDFATSSVPTGIAVGDLDGDGRPDAAVANNATDTVEVFLDRTTPGSTTPSFATRVAFATGSRPSHVAIADVNGDGKPDLVVADSNVGNVGADVVSVLLNTTAPGATAPSFATQVQFATGVHPLTVVAADFNGDGKPDLATANNGANTVSVLLNTSVLGATTPSFAAKVDFTAAMGPVGIACGDFDGDGKQDLAVANVTSNSVSVLLGTTTPGATAPSFAAKVDFATNTGPVRVATGDLNGDGRPDLAITTNAATVSVLLDITTPGATMPSFAAKVDLPAGMSPQQLEIGEVDGDGVPDLVVPNISSNTVSVFRNTTAPGATVASFAPRVDFATGSGADSVGLADLNGDGKPDLIVANQNASSLSVLLDANPWGRPMAFAAKADFTVGSLPHGLAAGDLNADGKADLVAVNEGASTVSVLLNTTATGATTAAFSAKTDFAVGIAPFQAAIVDVNGDGRNDVIVENAGNSISVLLNTTAPGATAPTFATKVDFATGGSPECIAIGDFNHDGRPDVVVANISDSTVSVLMNTTAAGATTPSFAAKVDFATGSGPITVAVADFNGDDNLDLVVGNQNANSMSILLNTMTPGSSTPSFAAHVDFTTGNQPASVVVGDLNGDGKPDVAVSVVQSVGVSVFLDTTAAGATAPSFTAKSDFLVAGNPFGIAIGDLDGDGRLDLAAANGSASNNAGVLRATTAAGATAASFASVVTFATGAAPIAIAVGQFNGDGKLDLVIANDTGNSVSILLGQ